MGRELSLGATEVPNDARGLYSKILLVERTQLVVNLRNANTLAAELR